MDAAQCIRFLLFPVELHTATVALLFRESYSSTGDATQCESVCVSHYSVQSSVQISLYSSRSEWFKAMLHNLYVSDCSL